MNKTDLVVSLTILLLLSSFVIPLQAEEKDEDLEWRLDLIKSSREMIKKENNQIVSFHRLGTVFTNFGEGNINTGLRIAPYIWQGKNSSLHIMGELFYLRKEDTFASFVSLYGLRNEVYIGAGAEITERAKYQFFAGWEVTDNIFIEARAINTEGDINQSKVYPVAGFQIRY